MPNIDATLAIMNGAPLSAADRALAVLNATPQQMLAAKASPSDPFTFIHALLAMDGGQFRQMLELLSAGQGGGL